MDDDTVKHQIAAIHEASDPEAAGIELVLLEESDNGPQDEDPT